VDHVADHLSVRVDHVFAMVVADTVGSGRLGWNHQ
jgi:hypothetical protein